VVSNPKRVGDFKGREGGTRTGENGWEGIPKRRRLSSVLLSKLEEKEDLRVGKPKEEDG